MTTEELDNLIRMLIRFDIEDVSEVIVNVSIHEVIEAIELELEIREDTE